MNKKMHQRPLMSLFPLFLILCIMVLSRPATFSNELIADESKYYEHAQNLTKGFYTDRTDPNLMEGPGYPLYLAFFEAFDTPFFLTRASNIILLFCSLLYLFLLLVRSIDRKPALVLTYLFGLYPPMLRWANLMYAEPLMLLLLLGFCYHFIVWFNREGNYKMHFFLASLFLGYLALTKIIFPYVILTALLIAVSLSAFAKLKHTFRLKGVILLLIGALFVLSPYVAYSYNLTGKFFYLGMHGGETLYARASPFDNEFGNWFTSQHVLQDRVPTGRQEVMANIGQLRINHYELFKSIDTLSHIQKDSVLTARAIENMKEHPSKYLKNTIANISRIFFHFPFSYRIQNLDTLGYLIPNIFIVVLAILGLYPAFLRHKQIPKELIMLFIFSIIYLGGHSLLDGRGRYLIPVVPIWLLFFSFVYFRILKISLIAPNPNT